MPHRDTVIDTDRVELERHPARFADRLFDDTSVLLQKEVARNNVDVRIGYTDERFVEIFIFQSRRTKKRTVRCFVEPAFNSITAH